MNLGTFFDRSRRGLTAAVAVLAVLAVVVIVAVGTVGGRVTGPGASTGASNEPSLPVASVPASAAVPSASAVVLPSDTPTPAPTAEPTPTPAATPTPVPSATASPSASAGSIPAGFEPVSVTFVSADEGFVLGSVACPSGRCATIAHTTDAGRSWSEIGAPATTIAPDNADGAPAASGVDALRFADSQDGWAFGPDLWATHDGGATWARVDVGLPGALVMALETARGITHAVVDDGTRGFRILTSPVATDTWRMTGVTLPFGAGPVPAVQLVLSGDAGWVLQNDRTVVNGARLRAGTWASWQPVCADVVGPAYLAASSATDLVAACDVGLWGDPKGGHLHVSTNGGSSAAETGTKIPAALSGAIASGTPKTIVVGGTDPTGAVLDGSFDGGTTWTQVLAIGDGQPVDLGFTTADQGVVVVRAVGTSRLFMTRDGGHTWDPVAF